MKCIITSRAFTYARKSTMVPDDVGVVNPVTGPQPIRQERKSGESSRDSPDGSR